MKEPEKPDADKLSDGIKGMDLDKFGDATSRLMKGLRPTRAAETAEEKLKGALTKGTSFFKKAKAALKGDEAAKEELADAAAKTLVKTGDALEKAGKAAGDMLDKVDKKVTAARDKKPPAP